MSMSQEEIEALMNGIDISESDKSKPEDVVEDEKESNDSMSENDIADLIAQSDLNNNSSDDKAEEASDDTVDNESIDDLLSELQKDKESEDLDKDSIDDLINNLDNENNDIDESIEDISVQENESSDKVDEVDEVETDDIDDLINSLDNVKENNQEDYLKDLDENMFNSNVDSIENLELKEEEPKSLDNDSNSNSNSNSNSHNNVINVDSINIPTQLGQVANDSEEKATKIFDALSYILDDNNELRKTVKTLDSFIQSQHKMLKTLNEKFPNIKEFSDNLEEVNTLIDKPQEIQTRLLNRDKELFETMELMQFHDINRQKIERVMGVVINLSKQLNSIFDDESSKINIPTSKHLPGDETSDIVGGDDLESLIAEFGN